MIRSEQTSCWSKLKKAKHLCATCATSTCRAAAVVEHSGGISVGARLHLYHFILVRHALLPFLSDAIVLCSNVIRSSGEQLGIWWSELTMNKSSDTQSQTHLRGQNNVPFFSLLFSPCLLHAALFQTKHFFLQMDQPTDTIMHEFNPNVMCVWHRERERVRENECKWYWGGALIQSPKQSIPSCDLINNYTRDRDHDLYSAAQQPQTDTHSVYLHLHTRTHPTAVDSLMTLALFLTCDSC